MNKEGGKRAAFYARVQGRVQGVGFRHACMTEAQRLRVSGWVRNTAAGDVEVQAEGAETQLRALLEWLHRGPPGARVEAVHCEETPVSGQYQRFAVV